MRDKIFNEILKAYPSCHAIGKRRKLTDKILALIKEHYIPIEYYRQQLDKFSISNGDSCEMCQIAYNDMGKALPVPCENILRKKGWKPPDETPTCYEKGCVSLVAQGNEQDLRAKGWLHKDDPVDRVYVKINNCTSLYAPEYPDCKKICQRKGCERPFTVGEALEMFISIVNIQKISYSCKDTLLPFLTIKDGGIVEMKND